MTVRLLLDEMWPPSIADQLRHHGLDASAVLERRDLQGQLDPQLFDAAQRERLTIVTENTRDFRVIAAAHTLRGSSHAGLIYTTHRQFPRNDHRTAGRLVRALVELLATTEQLDDIEHWLQPPR